MRPLWERFKNVAFWVLVGWFAIGLVLQAFWGDSKPREGEACGEGHRWVYVGIGENRDLSCEPER